MGGYLSSNTINMVVTAHGEGVNATTPASTVKVYPNPAKEIVNIEANKQVEYRITDILGVEKQKGMLCKGANVISLKALASGVYVLECISEKETISIKVIKE
jgi:hypothetical protein